MSSVTVAAYLVCLIAAVLLAAIGYRRRNVLAPVAEMAQLALAGRAIRIVLLIFWWWLGWHFLIGPTLEP